MNVKQRGLLGLSVVLISVLIVVTVVSIYPFAPYTPVLEPIDPEVDNDGSVYLEWGSLPGVSWYRLRMKKDDGRWETIIITQDTYFTKTGLTDGTYIFTVAGLDSNQVTVTFLSNEVHVTVLILEIIVVPIEPVLSAIYPAISDDGFISLEWNAVDGADRYAIYRAKNGGAFEPLIEISNQIYYDDVIEIDGTYTYKVRAGNDAGYSGFSDEKSVIVQLLVLTPPESPIMNDLTYTIVDEYVIVQLSWSEVDCDSYNVYRNTDFEGYILIEGNVLSTGYSDTLTDVGFYFYRVSAIDVSEESELSNPTIIEILEGGGVIVVDPEEPPTEPSDYTMLYALLIVLGVLAIPIVILVKKKKGKSLNVVENATLKIF